MRETRRESEDSTLCDRPRKERRPAARLRWPIAAHRLVLLVLLTSLPAVEAAANAALKQIPDPFFRAHCRLCPLEDRLFADAVDGRLDHHCLLEAALVASGVEDAEVLTRYRRRMDELATRLFQSGELRGTPQQQARAVFEFMHRNVLRTGYHLDATDLRAALDEGRFNCVSASVLFNCLAGDVGLTVCGLEIPGHAMSRLVLPNGSLDLETTCPDWFRLMNDPKRRAEQVEKTIGRSAAGNRADAREVSPLQMTAMVYYNRGVDLLAENRFAMAADVNTKAVRLDPANPTARGNLLATLNNWAIALGGSGRYAEAIDLLDQAFQLDPAFETLALNYVHVHHQWVEHFCGAGRFEEALAILARAAAEFPRQPYFHRAPTDVYRRWARSLLARGEADRAFAVFDRARVHSGDDPAIIEAEIAELIAFGLNRLEAGEYAEAAAFLDRAIARHPRVALLREHRRMAVTRRPARHLTTPGL